MLAPVAPSRLHTIQLDLAFPFGYPELAKEKCVALNEQEQKEYDEKGIKKKDLQDGAHYEGYGRSVHERRAVWCAITERFYYMRNKWGSDFVDSMHGPEDAPDRIAYFLPTRLIENPENPIAYQSHRDFMLSLRKEPNDSGSEA